MCVRLSISVPFSEHLAETSDIRGDDPRSFHIDDAEDAAFGLAHRHVLDAFCIQYER